MPAEFNYSVLEPPHVQNDVITINKSYAADHQVRRAWHTGQAGGGQDNPAWASPSCCIESVSNVAGGAGLSLVLWTKDSLLIQIHT